MRDFREEREKLIMRYINNKIKDNIEILKNYLLEFRKINIIKEKSNKLYFSDNLSDYIYRISIIDNYIKIDILDCEIKEIIEIFKIDYLFISDFSENRIKNIFKNYIMNLIDFD